MGLGGLAKALGGLVPNDLRKCARYRPVWPVSAPDLPWDGEGVISVLAVERWKHVEGGPRSREGATEVSVRAASHTPSALLVDGFDRSGA